jgi:hypothetical protein
MTGRRPLPASSPKVIEKPGLTDRFRRNAHTTLGGDWTDGRSPYATLDLDAISISISTARRVPGRPAGLAPISTAFCDDDPAAAW